MMGLSSQGDLGPFISGYFDTTAAGTSGRNTSSVGPKMEPNGYIKIAQQMSIDIKEVVVLSVDEKELGAAEEAGAHAVLRKRPANWSDSDAITQNEKRFPVCCSMMQLFRADR